ncbi:hypothetical protein [Salinimonas lutimaris]|uniref:hypothetical protein n=1 Tax=Salinimonas lutimaris TaxID=914153 RepID=UPI0010C11B86|nr:hypothetical protein [Salinimonas lutimaris]
MDDKTKGSWLIHHHNKLRSVLDLTDYDNILVSGKAGVLLSAISADNENQIDNDRLAALAKASGINPRLELPNLISTLKQHSLVDTSGNGIAVLGLTSSSVLGHTATIFDSMNPTADENASLYISERASEEPILDSIVKEEVSDTFKLSSSQSESLLANSEEIGFIDADKLGTSRLYFNGNLFRRENATKTKRVLDSLNEAERRALSDLNVLLSSHACVELTMAKKVLGESLFSKVCAVGLYDINAVCNSTEEVGFITLPAAFSKYSNAQVDDAFDLAKAFVSSITYGMTKSQRERGQIRIVEALLNAMIRGEAVGPVPAIEQDYKVLELKGVVKVGIGKKKGRTGPMMKLLKKEVGILALQVIQNGDASEHSLSSLPTAAVSRYKGPELNRAIVRKKQVSENALATTGILSSLRKGGF